MGWYFLPGGLITDPVKQAIAEADLMTSFLQIREPKAMVGLSFLADNVRLVLDRIGLADCEFETVPTDVKGVSLLTLKAGRKKKTPRPKARRPAGRPREGAEAFADAYLALVRERKAELEEERKRIRSEADEKTRELARVSAQLEQVEFQFAACLRIETDVLAELETEFEKMRADPRVSRLASTETSLMIETQALFIEAPPQRHALGRLRLTMGLEDGEVTLETIDGKGPSPHPLVETTGLLALGALLDSLIRYVGRREFSAATKLLLDLLTSVPRDEEARQRLKAWPVAPQKTPQAVT